MAEKEEARRGAATGQAEKDIYNKDSNVFDESQTFTLTFWQDIGGRDKKDVRLTWAEFVKRLENVKPQQNKKNSPLIKFARFGDNRTDAGSLRHDGNVIEVTGIEGDLDNEFLYFDQVREMIEQHNIKAVVCTTFSHTPEKPRLRVFAPLSAPAPPEDRRPFVARLNGILDGNLGEESFRLSQSFFIGGKPGSEYRVEHTFDNPEDGYFIDEDDALDEIAVDPDPQYQRAHTREHYINDEYIYTNTNTRGEDNKSGGQQKTTNDNKDNISFEKGGRDNAIFHLANYLVRGGMPHENIRKYLKFVAAHCTPPFPEKEIEKKITSAFQRAKNRDRNLTTEIRDFIKTTKGNFSTTEVQQMTTMTTSEDRKKVNAILSRMASAGDLIERTGRRHGEYRRIETECENIDFINAPTGQVGLFLPFKLHEKAKIMPGNIIVIAGEPNAGKTALLLNIVHDNMKRLKIHYFSSEMGGAEMRERLAKFKDTPLSAWKFTPKERSGNFGDVIVPGEGNINIVDFLELYDNFYEISGKLAEIHRKLNGAVAIVALQKNKGMDAGLGGERSLEKPRLYLNMGHGYLKIRKCKNFVGTENPNNKRINFKLVDGHKFIPQGDWHHES